MKKPLSALAAAGCIAAIGGLALAQSTVNVGHFGPYHGAPPHGPNVSLAALPPHPAEARGAIPKLTHARADGTAAHMMPTAAGAAARAKQFGTNAKGAVGFAPLTYHGGPIM